MGDRLGTPGAVGILLFFLFQFHICHIRVFITFSIPSKVAMTRRRYILLGRNIAQRATHKSATIYIHVHARGKHGNSRGSNRLVPKCTCAPNIICLIVKLIYKRKVVDAPPAPLLWFRLWSRLPALQVGTFCVLITTGIYTHICCACKCQIVKSQY